MHQFGRDFALVEGTLALALLFTTQLAAAEARVQDAEGHILDDTPTAQV